MPIPTRARRRTSGDSWYRLGYWLPGGPGAEFSQVWYRQRVAMLFSDGLQWLQQRLPAETVITTFGRGVVTLHDERRRTLDNKALDAARDTFERIFRQRLLAVEDGPGRDVPVNALRRGTPWRQLAALYLQ